MAGKRQLSALPNKRCSGKRGTLLFPSRHPAAGDPRPHLAQSDCELTPKFPLGPEVSELKKPLKTS